MMPCRQPRFVPIPVLLVMMLLVSLRAPAVAETPLLVFSTAPQNQPVSMTVHDPKLRYEFTVDSLKDEVADVQVTATPFTDAAGQRIPVKVTLAGDASGAGKPVKALRSLPVVLEAALPEPGVYTSYVSLIYNQQKWTPPLALSVSLASPEVDVPDNLPAGLATLWSGNKATLDLGVYEKSGRTIDLLTQLQRIIRKGANAARYSATASFKILGADRQELAETVTLSDKKTRQLRLELSDFQYAGEYEATLRFSPKSSTPIDRIFPVYVREPLWAAMLWIASGVLISYLIREYLVKTRPRLATLARIESLTLDLEALRQSGPLTPKEEDVVRALLGQLSELRKRLNLGTLAPSDATGVLDLLERKIPLLRDWIRLYQRLSSPIPASDQATLDSIEAVIRRPDASIQELKTAEASAAALAASISISTRAAAKAANGGTTPRGNLDEILRRMRRSDFLVTAVVLAIALLMGIQTLWINDLSWGGWGDRVVAVLWGLGLHQATFTGVEALRATLIR